MLEPVSRIELAWRVEAQFRRLYPDAPQVLDPEWRQGWIYTRDAFILEEISRVYWERYPEGPLEVGEDDPYHEVWAAVRDEVLANAPEPEDLAG